jgi:hypothetical protein
VHAVVVSIACIVLAGFVGVLIALHTYLISKGLTSWEYFSWMKITYMKVWPPKYGSPFTRGTVLKNFKEYFTPIKSQFATVWRMPS